nr:immunoglobulin light chain junction region [Macaca mulatta]
WGADHGTGSSFVYVF